MERENQVLWGESGANAPVGLSFDPNPSANLASVGREVIDVL